MKAAKEKQYISFKIAKRPLKVLMWILISIVILVILKFPANYFFLEWQTYCYIRPGVELSVAVDAVEDVRVLLKEKKIWTTVGTHVGSPDPTHVNVLRKDYKRVRAFQLSLDESIWEYVVAADERRIPWYDQIMLW